MATVVRSDLGTILLALQARVMSITGWPAERVIIDTDGDEQQDSLHYQAEQLVFIRKSSSSPDVGFEGMGRIWAPEKVRLNFVLWTRLALDEPPGFLVGLTDATLGHEPAALAIRNAILGFQVTDIASKWLVQQPIEPGSAQGPLRRKREDGTWAKSILSFYLTYSPAVSQDYQ